MRTLLQFIRWMIGAAAICFLAVAGVAGLILLLIALGEYWYWIIIVIGGILIATGSYIALLELERRFYDDY